MNDYTQEERNDMEKTAVSQDTQPDLHEQEEIFFNPSRGFYINEWETIIREKANLNEGWKDQRAIGAKIEWRTLANGGMTSFLHYYASDLLPIISNQDNYYNKSMAMIDWQDDRMRKLKSYLFSDYWAKHVVIICLTDWINSDFNFLQTVDDYLQNGPKYADIIKNVTKENEQKVLPNEYDDTKTTAKNIKQNLTPSYEMVTELNKDSNEVFPHRISSDTKSEHGGQMYSPIDNCIMSNIQSGHFYFFKALNYLKQPLEVTGNKDHGSAVKESIIEYNNFKSKLKKSGKKIKATIESINAHNTETAQLYDDSFIKECNEFNIAVLSYNYFERIFRFDLIFDLSCKMIEMGKYPSTNLPETVLNFFRNEKTFINTYSPIIYNSKEIIDELFLSEHNFTQYIEREDEIYSIFIKALLSFHSMNARLILFPGKIKEMDRLDVIAISDYLINICSVLQELDEKQLISDSKINHSEYFKSLYFDCKLIDWDLINQYREHIKEIKNSRNGKDKKTDSE